MQYKEKLVKTWFQLCICRDAIDFEIYVKIPNIMMLTHNLNNKKTYHAFPQSIPVECMNKTHAPIHTK